MTSDLVTISPATSIIAAARLMLDVGTRHLAIVEGDDIVGVVSMCDLREPFHCPRVGSSCGCRNLGRFVATLSALDAVEPS